MSWSRRRQLLYFFGTLGVLVLISIYPAYLLLHTPPSCTDGERNQSEFGVDCGGPCPQLCAAQVSDIDVRWAEAFRVGGGTYDLAALVQNPNRDAEARGLSYTFTVYDADGTNLASVSGRTYMNAEEQFVLVEPNISLVRDPERVTVSFDEVTWQQARPRQRTIEVAERNLRGTDTDPRLDATLRNTGVSEARNISIAAVVYNSSRDPVGVSRTYLDELGSREDRTITLSWPAPFTTKPEDGICTAPVDVMLAMDRSGSMDDDREEPPQPLTDAKEAAKDFVGTVQASDQVGVVSFADTAQQPVDYSLSTQHPRAEAAIDDIAIQGERTQHTNIQDAVDAALDAMSIGARPEAKQAIVLLTDGIANRPLLSSGEEDIAYAERLAAEKAAEAKEKKVLVYVIGLGSQVKDDFLKNRIATTPEHYYAALDSSELSAIYQEIARVVCKEEVFTTTMFIR